MKPLINGSNASFFILLSLLCGSFSTQAYELNIGLGKSQFFNSSLTVSQDGTSNNIDKPDYETETYLSLGFANWLEKQPRWGWETELNIIPHNLEYHEENTAQQQPSTLKLDYYQLMFNTHYRWFPNVAGLEFQPYIGAGLGIIISEFELKQASEENADTLSYTGLTGQGITGIRVNILTKLALSLEYKIAYMPSDTSLDGVELELSPWTQLVQLGLHYRF